MFSLLVVASSWCSRVRSLEVRYSMSFWVLVILLLVLFSKSEFVLRLFMVLACVLSILLVTEVTCSLMISVNIFFSSEWLQAVSVAMFIELEWIDCVVSG